MNSLSCKEWGKRLKRGKYNLEAKVMWSDWQKESQEQKRCIADYQRVLKIVEEWWLNEEKNHFHGAPSCIFAVREILDKSNKRLKEKG